MTERSGARILIVGCGEIGSRHLQAVATLPQIREIDVVDPRPEAWALGRARLAELADRQLGTKVRWLAALEDASRDGEICLVATQAEGRCRLVRQVAEQLGYSVFLVEKLVAQSMEEYQALLDFSDQRGLSLWVNCKTRAYPIHKWVKARLGRSEPIVLTVVSGNHGLANSGIHAADLFVFYDDASWIECVGSHISTARIERVHVSSSRPGSPYMRSTLTLSNPPARHALNAVRAPAAS